MNKRLLFGSGTLFGLSLGLLRPTPISNEPKVSHGFIADAAEQVLDSVVNISIETSTPKMFSSSILVSSGSGFFIEPDSILTNAHVVSDMTLDSKMIVTTAGGVEHQGYVHSMDSLADLAIIKLKSSVAFPRVRVGNTKLMRQGDWVVAIGSPFGLTSTVTAGVISSIRKASDIGTKESRLDFIQTDAVVHHGSSGGPLLNLNGEVIGINTTRAESEGISFAIRLDNALELVHQLVKHGKVLRPYLGLSTMSLSPGLWSQLRTEKQDFGQSIPALDKGVLVSGIVTHSPAQSCGLQEGDVITHVRGHLVENSYDLLKGFGLGVGVGVPITISRNVPLDMDWDGRVLRYETVSHDLTLTPTELDLFLNEDSREFV